VCIVLRVCVRVSFCVCDCVVFARVQVCGVCVYVRACVRVLLRACLRVCLCA
jgi:hypothetical protein